MKREAWRALEREPWRHGVFSSKLQSSDTLRCNAPAFVLCLALSSLLVMLGCSPKPTQAASPSAPTWSWAGYPAVEKMRLAVLPCRVMPKTSLTINAPLAGTLRLYVDRPQTNLPAGFVWAEFEPKILKAEADALAE